MWWLIRVLVSLIVISGGYKAVGGSADGVLDWAQETSPSVAEFFTGLAGGDLSLPEEPPHSLDMLNPPSN